MAPADLPEPVPYATPERGGERRARRSQAAWALVAIAFVVVGVVAVVNRRDQEVTDIEIALPLPTQVLMGGQTSTLGTDPDRGIEANVWLSVAGPRSSTTNGDLFHSQGDEVTTAAGTGSYDPAGHRFAVSVTAAPAGADLVIEAFDPAWVYVGDHCEEETGSRQAPSGTVRQSPRCTGDQLLGGGPDSTVTTTYLVRAPDATPDDDTDNPVVCASTYAGWPTGPNGGPATDGPEGVIVDRTYQSWAGLCRVPAAEVQPGAYVVQVRTNADLEGARWSTDASLAGDAGTLVDADPDAGGEGANRFALRAGWGDNTLDPTGVTIQAIGHLSIYANGTDASAGFSLVRVPTEAAGRTLRLGFWDLGDVSGGTGLQLTVGTPAGARSTTDPADPVAVACEVPLDTVATSIQVDGCRIGGIRTQSFNAAMLEVRVLIPADYRCDANDDCWLPLRLDYPGAHPADTTTWVAEWEQDGSTGRIDVTTVPGTSRPQEPGTVGTVPGTVRSAPSTTSGRATTTVTPTTVTGPPGTGGVAGTVPRRTGGGAPAPDGGLQP